MCIRDRYSTIFAHCGLDVPRNRLRKIPHSFLPFYWQDTPSVKLIKSDQWSWKFMRRLINLYDKINLELWPDENSKMHRNVNVWVILVETVKIDRLCTDSNLFIFDNGVHLPNCNECCLSILEFETFFKTKDRMDSIVSCVLRPIERFSAWNLRQSGENFSSA